LAVASVVAVSMAAALAAVASMAASAVVAWHSVMVVSAATDFVVVDSMIAVSGASDSATRIMTTLTTTLTLIHTNMGMAITRTGIDINIIPTPPAMGTTKTTEVAMRRVHTWRAPATPSGATDGLTIASRPQRSRAEVVALAVVRTAPLRRIFSRKAPAI